MLSCPALAPLYDLMLMLDPNVSEERRAEIVSAVQSMIESSGKIVGSHDWGMRRLAYEIDHRADAGYHLFQFEGPAELLERLDHSLKITDGVMRFRTIRLKPGSPLPRPPRADPSHQRGEEDAGAPVAARAAADSPAPGDFPAAGDSPAQAET